MTLLNLHAGKQYMYFFTFLDNEFAVKVKFSVG